MPPAMLHSLHNPDRPVPACACDRCASIAEGLPDTIPMAGGCTGCGGRATLPPLCVSCTGRWLEGAIALIAKSVEENGPASFFGRELMIQLQARKAQLPTGAERQAFWLGGGGRRDVQLRVCAKTRNT